MDWPRPPSFAIVGSRLKFRRVVYSEVHAPTLSVKAAVPVSCPDFLGLARGCRLFKLSPLLDYVPCHLPISKASGRAKSHKVRHSFHTVWGPAPFAGTLLTVLPADSRSCWPIQCIQTLDTIYTLARMRCLLRRYDLYRDRPGRWMPRICAGCCGWSSDGVSLGLARD